MEWKGNLPNIKNFTFYCGFFYDSGKAASNPYSLSPPFYFSEPKNYKVNLNLKLNFNIFKIILKGP